MPRKPGLIAHNAQAQGGLWESRLGMGSDGELQPVIVRLTPEGKREWIAFYNAHAEEHVELTGDLSAAWSKLEGYAARFALVVHFTRWAAGDPTLASPDEVDAVSVTAGVRLSRWFGYEARRVCSVLEESDETRAQRRLIELIRRKGGSATARDLMRWCRRFREAEGAEKALDGLVKASLGQWEDSGTRAEGGRPTRRFVLADSTDAHTTPESPVESEVLSTSSRPGQAGDGGPVNEPVGESAGDRKDDWGAI